MVYLADEMTKVDKKAKEWLEYAEKTLKMVNECTKVPLELVKGLTKSSSRLFNLEEIKIETFLKEITNDPCMPVKLKWQIYFGEEVGKSREKTSETELCFNGQFTTAFAEAILHESFPELELMHKTLDEASAR